MENGFLKNYINKAILPFYISFLPFEPKLPKFGETLPTSLGYCGSLE
jgi:hypothetical protein